MSMSYDDDTNGSNKKEIIDRYGVWEWNGSRYVLKANSSGTDDGSHSNRDRVYGGGGDDIVYGGKGSDKLYGESGDDVLYGDRQTTRTNNTATGTINGFVDYTGDDAGDDYLYGGSGNDKAYGGAGKDWLQGDEGNDELHGEAGDDKLFGGSGKDKLDGGDGNDRLFGGSGEDLLNGGDGNDKLFGGNGKDILNGGDGDDKLYGGNGKDILNGDAGNDKLHGGNGKDELNGGTGSDWLSGGRGADSMAGGGGAFTDVAGTSYGDFEDKLVGGKGGDDLWGGNRGNGLGDGNDDLFIYRSLSDSPYDNGDTDSWDEIFDFEQGANIDQGDKIDLRKLTGDGTADDLIWNGANGPLQHGVWYEWNAELNAYVVYVDLGPGGDDDESDDDSESSDSDYRVDSAHDDKDGKGDGDSDGHRDRSHGHHDRSHGHHDHDRHRDHGHSHGDSDVEPDLAIIVHTGGQGTPPVWTDFLGVVEPVDDVAPVFDSGTTATAINENSGLGQMVYDADATDPALDTGPSNPLTYSLGGTDGGLFTINSSTGQVYLTGNPDHETKSSYSFDVTATDTAGNATTQTVTLAVNDLDEVAPVFDSGTTATAINENSGLGQMVYDADATDPALDTGPSNPLTYSLGGTDGGLFTINSSTGQVYLTGNPDHETKSSYSFDVTATDTAGNATTQTVTLAVNDLDEVAPVAANLTPSDNEDTTITITLSGTDAGGIASYTLTSLPSASHGVLYTDALATVLAAIGTPYASPTLYFKPAADYNGAASFNYTVTDTAGNSDATPATVSITVNAVADIVGDTVTTLEDTAISFNPITGTNGAEADNFEGGNPQITHINGLAITAGGAAVAVTNGSVTLAADNILTFTPAADFNGAVPSFSYTVLSGGVSETANIDVTVTPQNDPPVLALNGGAYVLDQFGSQAYNLNNGTANWVGNWTETADNFLGATNGSPVQGDLQIANDPTVFSGNFRLRLIDTDAETDNTGDQIQRTVDLTGATSATLSFDYRRDIPAGDADDVVLVRISTDGTNFTTVGTIGGGTFVDSGYQTFTYNLLPSQISATTIVQFSIGDDVDNGDVFFIDNVKVAYTGAIQFTEGGSPVALDQGSDATVADIDSADFNTGTLTVAITAGGASAEDVLSIGNVGPITTGVGTVLHSGTQIGTFTGGTGGSPLVITLDGDATPATTQALVRALQYSNSNNANPSTAARTIGLTLTDGDGGTSSTSFVTVKVNAVNDAPDTNAGSGSGNEDAASIAVSLSGTDVDGTVASFIITSLPANGTLYADAGHTNVITVNETVAASGNAATVYFVPNANFNGAPTFQYAAIDNNGLQDATPATATVTVNAVNDAPVLNAAATPAGNAVAEDSGAPVGAVGTLVSQLIDLNPPVGGLDNVIDIDDTVTGIAVIAADTANGSWFYSINGGTNWFALGAVTDDSARLLAADANTRLYFQPNANYDGQASITFRAWDQDTGTNGGLADPTPNGGSTAFSTATDTAIFDVTPVNDITVINNVNLGSVVNITEWAILANDLAAGPGYDINSVGGAIGGTVTHTAGTGTDGTVNFTDVAPGGGSFTYTSTGPGGGTSGLVVVVHDDAGALDGTAGNDILINQIAGTDLIGGDGNDILLGGSGNDDYFFDLNDGADVIWDLGSGSDTIVMTTSGAPALTTLGFERVGNDLTINVDSTQATVRGHYNAGSNNIEEITFQGGASFHGYSLGTGAYNLDNDNIGGGGNDVLASTSAGETLSGSNNNDLLFGNGGNDTLAGDNGNDLLVGGTGADTMTGGGGGDTFGIALGDSTPTIGGSGNAGTITGYDVITDFSTSLDKLSLPGAAAAGGNFAAGNGNDSTLTIAGQTVKSHAVTTGVITFDDAASFGSALVLTSTSQVAAVVQYLQSNDIGAASTTLAFTATISGTAHTYIYHQGGDDNTGTNSLVDLSGVTIANLTALTGVGNRIDPLILDLGAAGYDFTGVLDGVSFDINADALPDQIAWTLGEDGILALDLNGSGTIDNGAEIFSPYFAGVEHTGSLAALATLDENADGQIDASDSVYGRLQVWQDLDHDGVSDAGELTDLTALGIASINLAATPADHTIAGQQVMAEGSFTYADGSTGNFVEVAFDTVFGTAGAPAHSDPMPSEAGLTYVIDPNAPPATIESYLAGDRLDLSALLDASFVEGDDVANYVRLQESGADITVQVDVGGLADGENFVDVVTLVGYGTSNADIVRAVFAGQEQQLSS